MKQTTFDPAERIAIVGISCRFPGAKGIREFWENLKNGVESISFFTDEELVEAGIDATILGKPNFIRAKPVLEDIELFDATFFGFNPREAELLDPQHRLFLECAWEALEDAGCNPSAFDGRIGLYAGTDANTYLINNLLTSSLLASVGAVQSMMNDKDYLSTRVSYKLNLRGPSITVQTACSTSLVAVHLACESLLNSECDMALAGAVSISVPKKSGYFHERGGVLSPDGHCRTFDAKAQGTIFGDGIGIVVLKRLDMALEDGDHIYAIICGSAVNNDGAQKVGYTAPSVEGQTAVIAEALSIAEISPETITYVEAHGTGTELGDPIELMALTHAFRRGTNKKNYCALGAVKTNVGHLSTAAGVAGLIKTVLALQHKQIPPSLHFEEPNPEIDFRTSPFFVNTTLKDWEVNGMPRRAGVSSFGMGGTNAHLILEEGPPRSLSSPSRPWHLMLLSAKTETALTNVVNNLADYLPQQDDLNLADVAYTLQTGRQAFAYRQAFVCRDHHDVSAFRESAEAKQFSVGKQTSSHFPVAFMFSGIGDQYPNMGLTLYQHELVYRSIVDHCAEFLRPYLGLDLRAILYPTGDLAGENVQMAVHDTAVSSSPKFNLSQLLQQDNEESEVDEATRRLNQPSLAYPAVFVTEYALAQLLQAWGIRPQAMIGYSIGEYVAACVSGVLSLEDALVVIARRGQLVEELSGGAMLAVMLSEEKIRPFLEDGLSLSAVDGPLTCVVGGSAERVAALEQTLLAQKIACRRVQTTHAFHSAMVEPMLASLTTLLRQINLKPPQIPYLSNLSGTWITDEQATDPDYWARQMRHTVQFSAGVAELWQEDDRVLVEVGPGNALTTLAIRHPASQGAKERVLPTMRRVYERQSDIAFLLNTLGKLWVMGAQIDWQGFYQDQRRQRVALPTYPFEPDRYWVEPGSQENSQIQQPMDHRSEIADWFYLPTWKRAFWPASPEEDPNTQEQQTWLLFVGPTGIGHQLGKRLQAENQQVISVLPGTAFAQVDDTTYTIDPERPLDYQTLVQNLAEAGTFPDKVLHFWATTVEESLPLDTAAFETEQNLGVYSLLLFVQELECVGTSSSLEITVVTNSIHAVTGDETLHPEQAPVLALCNALPQEYAHIMCRVVDLLLPQNGANPDRAILDRLMLEVRLPVTDTVVAHRGQHRWIPAYDPVRLTAASPETTLLRERGVYLITGGLGHTGLIYAEFLAEAVQARLILAGSQPFPASDEWDQHLHESGDSDAVAYAIHKIRELETKGAEVLVTAVDVADYDQMQALITQIQAQFGALHGVIHAAGTENETLFNFLRTAPLDDMQAHLRHKAQSVLVLQDVLTLQMPDFCLLSASLSTILGGAGFALYAAADHFLDAFVQGNHTNGRCRWINLNWDGWQQEEVDGAELEMTLRPDLAYLTLSNEEKKQVLRRIFTVNQQKQVIVSTESLTARIERNHKSIQALHRPIDQSRLTLYERPVLRTDYVSPENKTEQQMAEIWQQALGIRQIGIHDDFFELGGNSLLAVQVIFQIQLKFDIDISMANLVRQPTISFLANYVDTIRWMSIDDAPDQRDNQEEATVWQEMEF